MNKNIKPGTDRSDTHDDKKTEAPTNLGQRAGGWMQEVGGAVRKNVGHAIGNDEMERKGQIDQRDGKVRKDLAKGRERIKGAAEQLSGEAEGRVGEIIDNEQMQVEGKVKTLKGKARQTLNR